MTSGMTDSDTQAGGTGSDLKELYNQNRTARNRLFGGVAVVALCSCLAVGYWWLFLRNRVSTDNAYVAVSGARISSRVAGTISQINIDTEYFIAEGDVLLELETQDYRVLADKARAALAD